jgi:hypothetical protein
LTKAGFKDIQVFWRNHNFLGAIVIKWVQQYFWLDTYV